MQNIVEHEDIIYIPIMNGLCLMGVSENFNKTSVTIPKEINSERVLVIEDSAFMGLCTLENISLPSTIERIGAKAFYNCTSLQEVIFRQCPYNKEVEVGALAFSNCGSLKSINRYVLLTGQFAFRDCRNLSMIATVGVIPRGSFAGNFSLKDVYLFSEPDETSIEIENGAFEKCSKITSLFVDRNKNVQFSSEELDVFQNATIYCTMDCNLAELIYSGYRVLYR